MTKLELVKKICKDVNLKKEQAEKAIISYSECIRESVKEGGSIRLPNVGTISYKKRNQRNGVNPATGKRMVIPASKTAVFKISKDFKEYLNK